MEKMLHVHQIRDPSVLSRNNEMCKILTGRKIVKILLKRVTNQQLLLWKISSIYKRDYYKELESAK